MEVPTTLKAVARREVGERELAAEDPETEAAIATIASNVVGYAPEVIEALERAGDAAEGEWVLPGPGEVEVIEDAVRVRQVPFPKNIPAPF